jgi:tetratricopeptide (TPR) repeat protein
MAWTAFPYPDPAYRYTPESLQAAWTRLHSGDREAFPGHPVLVQAWIAFHAGEFERAARLGLDVGVNGYSVAHKAICMYANYLESSDKKKLATFECVAERCERQQREQPDNPAGYYWHAYALGQYSQGISVMKALAQGLGAKVKHSLDKVGQLAPQRADAHIALGVYHTEIIDKAGAVLAGLTYGVKKEEGYRQFETALQLNPDSAIARIQYARALLMLDGKKKVAQAMSLYEQAACCDVLDATERLDQDAARKELEEEKLGGALVK